jgi:hypothetical protein
VIGLLLLIGLCGLGLMFLAGLSEIDGYPLIPWLERRAPRQIGPR